MPASAVSIAKRIAMVAVGYVTAVLSFVPILAVVYGLAAALAPGHDKWTLVSVSPILLITAPFAALFVLVSTFTLTAVPMAVMAGLTEYFSWRAAWLYAGAGAIAAVACFFMLYPLPAGASDLVRPETLLLALAGALCGLIYWAISGRKAGF